MCAAGVRLTKIRELDENDRSVLLVGVIIAVQAPKVFPSKRGGGDRANWGFTIRDSPYDCINAAVWGEELFVFELSRSYHIGDVVEIANPKIFRRRIGEPNDNFAPDVSSLFQLNIASDQSTLLHYTADNPIEIMKLMHYVTKPSGDFFTLNDIHTNKENMSNSTVNLLAAVRSVGSTRQIKTRDGRQMECRDVTLLDQTNNTFVVCLWNPEHVLRASSWKPRETVLFLADVRVSYNEYRKQMAGSDGPKTVVTENPTMAEADRLREHARSAPLDQAALVDSFAAMIPEPQSIRNAMTIHQLLLRSESMADKAGSDEGHFCALLYCFVVKLDLDGCFPAVSTRCVECNTPSDDMRCAKATCPVANGDTAPRFTRSLDVRVTLSDHTGSVDGCRLNGAAAERVLGLTADQFTASHMDERTALKWRFLLERCATRVLVVPTPWGQHRPQVSVLACEVADPSEVAARIPTF